MRTRSDPATQHYEPGTPGSAPSFAGSERVGGGGDDTSLSDMSDVEGPDSAFPDDGSGQGHRSVRGFIHLLQCVTNVQLC